jgi:hypothetical protein
VKRVSLSAGVHCGKWGGFCLPGILRDSRRASEGEHLSLRELCYGNLRDSFSGDPEGNGRRATERKLLTVGGPTLGNLAGCLFTWELRRLWR